MNAPCVKIYLASFEGMVKKEKPWTIMNAYNKLNGTYLCENKEMLTDVLRREWGFDGYVMTDWGAMNDRVEALKAGCNLEMPSCEGATDAEIVAAVQDGTLDVQLLGRGFAWLDTGTMDSLVDAADFVRMIEKRQSIKISAPEEIAYRNGWIDRDALLASAARYGKSPYGEHLKAVAEGKIRY